jgi:hypothetical protein
MLREVRNGKQTFALANGPRLSFANAPAANDIQWTALPAAGGEGEWTSSPSAAVLAVKIDPPRLASHLEITLDYPRTVSWAGFKLEISSDGNRWETIYDATRRSGDGKVFEFPPQRLTAVRMSQFRRSDGQPITVKGLRVGYAAARFPGEFPAEGKISTGSRRDPQTGKESAWMESTGSAGLTRFRWTMQADGALRLDYEYALNGDYAYYGVSFDYPEDSLRSVRWLGGGPYRVWKNRLRGASLGVHETAWHDVQPGENWDYPESQGYFSSLRWARIETAGGPITVTSAQPEIYLRIGTPRFSLLNTSPEFPAGDISFLQAIPAIGSKFVTSDRTGPLSGWSHASGRQAGSLTFRFGR